MLNNHLENMVEAKDCPNRNSMVNRMKALIKFNIKRIERNIKLVQQRSMETIAFCFVFVSEPLLNVKKVNTPRTIHQLNKKM